jgi:hypothetical protein
MHSFLLSLFYKRGIEGTAKTEQNEGVPYGRWDGRRNAKVKYSQSQYSQTHRGEKG